MKRTYGSTASILLAVLAMVRIYPFNNCTNSNLIVFISVVVSDSSTDTSGLVIYGSSIIGGAAEIDSSYGSSIIGGAVEIDSLYGSHIIGGAVEIDSLYGSYVIGGSFVIDSLYEMKELKSVFFFTNASSIESFGWSIALYDPFVKLPSRIYQVRWFFFNLTCSNLALMLCLVSHSSNLDRCRIISLPFFLNIPINN